jgi:S1-C subfamily serine protease
MRPKASTAGLFTALLLWPTICAAQEDLAALVARAALAVVTVNGYDAQNQPIAGGSGFLLEDGRVVTGVHVLRGAVRVEILGSQGTLIGMTSSMEAFSNAVDVAILPRLEMNLPGLSLAGDEPAVGTRIVVIGAPRGLSNTVSDGIVSAARDIESRRLLQITAPISPGSSGSPVLDMNGSVVGMVVSTLRTGENLNFAVPAASIRTLQAGPPERVPLAAIAGPGPRPQRITFGVPMTGRLHFDCPQLPDLSFFQDWLFDGRAGETVTITMTSSDFDAYLTLGYLTGDRVVPIAKDDDGGSGTDARIVHRLPADGEYIVRANSFEGGCIGNYILRVDR